MSEPRSNPSSENCSPACERELLIIEVMGLEHPDPYAFRIYDETNQQQQEWLEGQASFEDLDSQRLHCWPWEGIKTSNVWLDIAVEDGAPIRVPLFSEVAATPRQLDEQWNRIWPVVPLTLLSDPEPDPGLPRKYPVPVRPGYIYIFREGLLWRELEVVNAPSGQLEFKDVRLLDYRSELDQSIEQDRRSAVGLPLESIWLPVRGMERSLTGSFEWAYSEVQWSADRVSYLEVNATARSERCVQPESPNRFQAPDAEGQWANVSELPEMRVREAYLEQHLPKPWKSVHDLSGTHSSNLFGQAVEEQEAFATDRNSAESAYETATYRDAPLRGAPSVRVAALEAVQKGVCDGTDDQALWQPMGHAPDALARVRERGWGLLALEDRLFEVRHRLTQVADAQRYLATLTEVVGGHRHADSAQLVHRVMGPQYICGKRNPLHEHLDQIDSGLFGKLHSALRTAQRELAAEEMALGQQRFVEVIERPENQLILADLFSLKGADYIEGFALAHGFVRMLLMNPRTDDKLRIGYANVQAAYTDRAQSLLLDLLRDGSRQPLHAMLFPAGDGDALAEENESEKNYGDGRARSHDIKALAEEYAEPDTLQTLTAVVIAGIARHESMELTTLAKRVAAGVDAVFDGFNKSAQTAIAKLTSRIQRVDARLYTPLLRQAKARAPELLGELRLLPRSAVPANWVILGVTDPLENRSWGLTDAERQRYVHGANGHKRFYGEFYRPGSDTPLATTNRARMPNLGDAPEARDFHIYAAPASAEVTDAHRKMRSLTRWDEIAERVRLPYFLVVLEGFNLWSEAHLFERVYKNRGGARAYGGVISAGTDLFVASALVTERLMVDVANWNGLKNRFNATSFKISKNLIGRFSNQLASALPRLVSYRLLGGLVGGGITAVVFLMDMVHEFDTGDYDAASGYAAAAAGGGMMMVGGLMFSSASQAGAVPVLMGLGPVGWTAIGIGLSIAGIVAVLALDDPPIVDWLKRGPFGEESDDQYPHLISDPTASFYRLVGLFTQPRITIETVRDMPVQLLESGIKMDALQEKDWSRINHRVIIENNLSALLEGDSLTNYLRLVTEITTLNHRPSSSGLPSVRRTIEEESPEIVLEKPLSNGVAYYLALPPSKTERSFFRQIRKSHSVAVRAQWLARLDGERAFYFPSPELDDPTSFSSAYSSPDFGQTNRQFWADEQTHQVE